MKLKYLLLSILGLTIVSCNNNDPIQQPTGLLGEQQGEGVLLTWNEVANAVSYDIARNGDYIGYSNTNSYTDQSPEEGYNLYEVKAFDGKEYSAAATIRVKYEKTNNGGNGGEQEVVDFYIKHSWGSGADEDWAWQPMRKQTSSTYTYTGAWGGIGANVNTVADDAGAEWYPQRSISGAESLDVGDVITFLYDANNKTLSIEGANGGNDDNGDALWIKHPWGSGSDESWTWQQMTKESADVYVYVGAWGGIGANISYTPDDDMAVFIPASAIENADCASIGQSVIFEYRTVGLLSLRDVTCGGGGSIILPADPSCVTVKNSSTGLVVEWDAVSQAVSYNVYRSVGSNSNFNKVDNVSSTSYTDTNVSSGTTYYYRITAVNSSGREGNPSSVVSATYKESGGGNNTSKPNTPTGLSATASSSSISLSWNSANGATYYKIYRSTSASGSYSELSTSYSTSYSDNSASAGTTYYYKVSAVNSAGESAMSSYASAKITSSGGGGGSTSTQLSAPANLEAYGGSTDSYVQISFDPVSLAQSYELYRSKSPNSGYSKISASGGSSGSRYVLTDSSPLSGTSYYKVKAIAPTSSYYNLKDSELSSYVKVTR